MWVKNAGHPYSTWILNSKGNDAKHNLRKPKNMFWEFEKKSFQNSKTPLSAAFQSSSLFSVDWRVENISNSGGSHGLLGMQNSGFEKKRKKKKNQNRAGFSAFFTCYLFFMFFVHSKSETIHYFTFSYYFEASTQYKLPLTSLRDSLVISFRYFSITERKVYWGNLKFSFFFLSEQSLWELNPCTAGSAEVLFGDVTYLII